MDARAWIGVFCALLFAATGRPASRPLNGVAVQDLGNPFFVQVGRGAEAKARELGGSDVKFTVASCGYDLNLQMNQIEDFISAGFDLIVLNAADSAGIAPAVRKARAAGITVVAVDVAAQGGVDATVMSDNVQAGVLAADFLVKKLGGQGNIVIVNGAPVSSVVDRVAGADEVFRRYPGIRILSRDQNGGASRMGGMSVMADLLTAFPQIDAVFAINDPCALGAALAVQQARRTGITIASVDGAPEGVQALHDSKSPFLATAAQDPYAMAEKAVEIGYEIMQGHPPSERRILVPVTLVTRDNVGAYRGWTYK